MNDKLSLNGRLWQVPDHRDAPKEGFAEWLLQERGINDLEAFLHPTIRDLMPNPRSLSDIEKAAESLMQTLVSGGGITILADFDVDGATSAALLFHYGEFFGVRPLVEVPERLTEGFGPNRRILDASVGRECDLLLCLDCGTSAADLFQEYAHRLKVIIVDHHQPNDGLPEVFALVNPHCSAEGRKDFADLAAVGVVFMLLVVTNQCFKRAGREVPDLMQFLDLVALGTVCDMVPMRGVNRAFVHRGLELMGKNPRMGIANLLPSRATKDAMKPEDLSFTLGPKLNAGSRMGCSHLPWQLLVESDPERAKKWARQLSSLNNQRQKESLSLAMVAEKKMRRDENMLFAGGVDWPVGILGILAGRLSRRWHRPCFVVSYNDQGAGSGSVRSVAGVDVAELLQKAVAAGVLERGGGHEMAGGFGLLQAKEVEFVDFARQYIGTRTKETPKLVVDAVLHVKDCSWKFLRELQRLEPFGVGNPEPVFFLEGVKLRDVALMGKEHLRGIIVDDQDNTLNAVLFGEAQSVMGKTLQQADQERFDLLVRLKPDFRIRGRVTAHIEDAREL